MQLDGVTPLSLVVTTVLFLLLGVVFTPEYLLGQFLTVRFLACRECATKISSDQICANLGSLKVKDSTCKNKIKIYSYRY